MQEKLFRMSEWISRVPFHFDLGQHCEKLRVCFVSRFGLPGMAADVKLRYRVHSQETECPFGNFDTVDGVLDVYEANTLACCLSRRSVIALLHIFRQAGDTKFVRIILALFGFGFLLEYLSYFFVCAHSIFCLNVQTWTINSPFAEWSSPPDVSGILAEWYSQAQRSFPGGFKQVWAQTLSEMLALLEKSLKGINAGAISLDSRILQELGCFDRKVNGAGTICAAAAIYLASKYAPDPQNGLAEAATLKGADTDTIASMAGCLLGTIAGTEWLQRYRNQLQDESYITKIAQRLELVQMDQNESNGTTLPTAKHSHELDRFLLLLRRGKVSDVFETPDGRKASISRVLPIKTASQNLSGTQWELKTDDGQILYVKKLERKAKDASQPEEQIGSKDTTKSSARRKRLGFKVKIKAIKVVVQNLERSRWFYQDILGLKIARESKTLVNFGELLTLVSHDHGGDVESPNRQNAQTHAILCLECSDIQSCHDRLRTLVEVKVTPIRDWSGRKAFRCVDMDGNVLEIFESLPNKQQISDQKP